MNDLSGVKYFVANFGQRIDTSQYSKLLKMLSSITEVRAKLISFNLVYVFIMGFLIIPRTIATCIDYSTLEDPKPYYLALGVMVSIAGLCCFCISLYLGIKMIISKTTVRKHVEISKWSTALSTCSVVWFMISSVLVLLMTIIFTAIHCLNKYTDKGTTTKRTVQLDVLVVECCAMVMYVIMCICSVSIACYNLKGHDIDAMGSDETKAQYTDMLPQDDVMIKSQFTL